ncbi:MAG: hypothetical protein RIM23_13855 [Coleofasciculus sp. G3-WIS-01]|uniref:hypothetical protein n=1 Tax=Coleofasciculus sp. G3-WIS-01 TaxID=3069528 RepID=UPI0032F9502D
MFNWCNFLKGRICARKSGSTVQAILKPGGNASDIVMLYFWTAETLPWVDKLPNQSSNTS